MGRRRASEIPHAVPFDDFHRHRGELRHGTAAAPAARPAREYRNAARVRARLRRCLDPAQEAPGPGPSLPHALGSRHPDPRRRVLPGPDGDVAGRYLDSADRVVVDRVRDLLRLQPETQPPAAGVGRGWGRRARETWRSWYGWRSGRPAPQALDQPKELDPGRGGGGR